MQLACDFAQFLLCKKKVHSWIYMKIRQHWRQPQVRISPLAFDFLGCFDRLDRILATLVSTVANAQSEYVSLARKKIIA
jgi:hypothetical protein